MSMHKDNLVVCVLGMHRSGTSMVTSLLHTAGVSLGSPNDLLMEGEGGNEPGHWEHKEFLRINDEIIATFGGTWLEVPLFPKNWVKDERLQQLHEQARQLVKKMNNSGRVWGFKDPRTCLTLPFWKLHIPNMVYIVPTRDAVEVAESLQKRQNIPIHQGITLWSTYWKHMILNLQDEDAIFTQYDNYFNDWKIEFQRVIDFIGSEEVTLSKHINEIEAIIDPSARHNVTRLRKGFICQLTTMQAQGNNLITLFVDELHYLVQHIYDFSSTQINTLQELRLSKDKSIEELQKTLRSIQQQSDDLLIQRTVFEKENVLKEGHIANLEKENVLKEGHIANLEKENVLKEGHIANLEKENVLKEGHIANLETSTVEQQKALEEQQKTEKRLYGEVKQFSDHNQELIHALELRTKEKESADQLVRDRDQMIVWMESSIFWKLRNKYVKLKSFRIGAFKDVFGKALGVLHHSGVRAFFRYTALYLKHGRGYFKHQAVDSARDYQQWIARHEVYDNADVARRVEAFTINPLISIITPVYNTSKDFLRACADSVVMQSYQHWELLMHDDASTSPETLAELKEIAQIDKRIRITHSKENEHISGASNHALKTAKGEYITFLDHDDTISPHALMEVVSALHEHPDAKFIYSDEDNLTPTGERANPFFKPDWNPDLFFSMNYTNHMSVYSAALVKKVGGMRKGYEGSQDYDLTLRILDHIKESEIVHIPKVLYHWRQLEGSTSLGGGQKSYTTEAGMKALRDYLKRNAIDATVVQGATPGRYHIQRVIKNDPLVSIIIPFRDQAGMLERCVESIFKLTTYKNFEIVLANNQSEEADTLAFMEKMKKLDNVHVVDYDKPFNFSAINNFAATKAKGDYLLFLNNDTKVLTPHWLSEMLQLAQREDVGAVGAKLLYPNNTIQHAGVVVGIQPIAGHAMKYFPKENQGYFSMLDVVRDYSAVTAACLLVKKKLFTEVDGFNEKELGVAYNDVDFCLRLAEKGYHNVYTPYAELYHYESVSRGDDEEMQKTDKKTKDRLTGERAYMMKRWSSVMEHDPAYNENLTKVREDFTIRVD